MDQWSTEKSRKYQKICPNWRQWCGISRIFCREKGICSIDSVCLDPEGKMSRHGQQGTDISPALPFSHSFCWERAIKPTAQWMRAYRRYASSFPSGFLSSTSLPPPRHHRSLFDSVLGLPEPHLPRSIRMLTYVSSSPGTGFFRYILSIPTICFCHMQY